jgi:iron complex outermembrane receptor protein
MMHRIPRQRAAAGKALATALATAFAALFAAPAFSQQAQDKTLAPVVVSASRFASDPAHSPIGATVIDAEQIREAGISNVNEAVRKLGGVYGRQNFSGTQDYSIDLRGFGSSSDQNMVVMVDGVRLSENELVPALLSSVPIESVERIEIVRGGSSVLYGEGATGGTIQVITKRGAAKGSRGTVVAEAGSFGYKELRASTAKSWGGFSLDANVGTLRTDNYRDNNELRQHNFSGGAQWASDQGRIALRADAARQDTRFAGALTLDEFNADPRQTKTPDDFGSFDTNLYSMLAERRFGAFDVAAELSYRDRDARAAYVSPFGRTDTEAKSHVTQFSPRIRHRSENGGIGNELVAGLDFARWTRDSNGNSGGFAFTDARAKQKSQAIYLRDEVSIGNARLAAGVRHENFDQDFGDPLGFATTGYDKSQSLNAWELQGRYAFTPELAAFAKAGRSYRVANADENALTPIPNQPLEPQTSHDLELGLSAGGRGRSLTARVFRHRLENEIFYNPLLFTNVNLDPTRRQGIELEANMRLLAAFNLSATLQHISAKFRDGPNDGNEMVLVPRNTATLRLNWQPGAAQSASVGLQWVDSQRYGGDFANSCSGRMPSFTTLDARYAMRVGAWEFALSGSNLTDRDYFSNAFGDCRSGIYPDPGRQLRLSARMDF